MNNKDSKITKKDIAYSFTKAGLGAVPVIGSLATEIFELLVTPPLERRRAEWMNEIAAKLTELEKNQAVNFSELIENEQFVDVVLQATSFALKTSEKRKIESFRNAILNTATGNSPDKSKSQIFLNQLDKFTIWHIVILDFVDSPTKWFSDRSITPPNVMMGSLHSTIVNAFPELKGQDELLDIIWNDLESVGFHRSGSLKSMMSGNGALSSRTTAFGKEFISFISKSDVN